MVKGASLSHLTLLITCNLCVTTRGLHAIPRNTSRNHSGIFAEIPRNYAHYPRNFADLSCRALFLSHSSFSFLLSFPSTLCPLSLPSLPLSFPPGITFSLAGPLSHLPLSSLSFSLSLTSSTCVSLPSLSIPPPPT